MAIRTTQQAVDVLSTGDGALRTTQQSVDVLSTGANGTARVTQQSVEVLSKVAPPVYYAESALALSQSADPGLISEPASSTLSMSQSAVPSGKLSWGAASSIIVTQTATYTQPVKSLTAENTLSLTQAATNNIKKLFAGNTLALTQELRIPSTHVASAANTLSLSQSAAKSGKLHYFAENTLVFADDADNSVKKRDVTSNIAFTQTATYDYVKIARSTITLTQEALKGAVDLNAENSLNLTQRASSIPTTRQAGNTLSMSQEAKANIRWVQAASTLSLSQDISAIVPWRVSATSELTGSESVFNPVTGTVDTTTWEISQEATVVRSSALRDAENVINLGHSASAVLVKSTATSHAATSTLSLTSEAVIATTQSASSQLNLGHSVTVTNGKVALSDGLFGDNPDTGAEDGQIAIVKVVRGNPALSEIDISQSVTYTLIKPTTECDYTPFVGESSDPNAPTAPSGTLPAQSYDPTTVRFKLVVPAFGSLGGGSPLDSVVLRAPDFGNREGVQTTRVNRETRGGTLLIHRDPVWPQYYKMTAQFSALDEPAARKLLRFMEDHLGLEVGVQDQEGRTWRGTILNPDEAIIHDGRGKWSATLEFELEKDPV